MKSLLFQNCRRLFPTAGKCRFTNRLLSLQTPLLLLLAVLILNGCTTTNSTSSWDLAEGNALSNDHFSDATDLWEDDTASGYVSNRSSQTYRLRLNHKTKVYLDLLVYGYKQDLDLFLYDSNRRLLHSSSKGAGSNEDITASLSEGSYFIEVKPYQSSASKFKLSIQKTEESLALTPLTSALTLLETGTVSGVVGTLSNTKDVWYKLYLNKKSTLNLILRIARPGQDLDMTLTNGRGDTLYATARDTTEGLNVELEPGQYYVRVFAYEDRFGSEFTLESTATALAQSNTSSSPSGSPPKEPQKTRKKHVVHKHTKKHRATKQAPESLDQGSRVQRINPEPRIQRLDQEPRVIKLN